MGNWFKDKTKINLTIDTIMFVVLMAITGIGFLMKYVLVPGYIRKMYDDNVELYFLGLNRHGWGSIHLWLGFLLLSLLAFHIILHWKIIISIFQRMVPIKRWRIVISVIMLVIGLFMALFPFLIKPKQLLHEPRHRNRNDNTYLFPSNQHESISPNEMALKAKESILKGQMYEKR
jgi:hypothetical protein